MMRPLCAAALAVVVAASVSAQTGSTHQTPESKEPAPTQLGERSSFCGTPVPDASLEVRASGDCSLSRTNPFDHYGPDGGRLRIPVVVHVLMNTDGDGYISPAQVASQIEILNEDFLALPGTPGENGINAEIEFYLATEDAWGNPANGITYYYDDLWFEDRYWEPGGDYFNVIAWDPLRFVNVYTNTAGVATGYVPGFPQQIGLVGENHDRIVVQYDAFGRDSANERRNQGRALTHEFGHYFGLLHTFQGCYAEGDCNGAGDLVCDTPPSNGTNFDCADGFHCGTPDDFQNFMDYTDDLCMQHFTSDQVRRMRCTLQEYRPTIYEVGGGGCDSDSGCDDGDPCNGVEFCVNGICNDGTITDCNYNGIDDSCDMASGFDPDCNENGVPDSCDINIEPIEESSGRLAPIAFGYDISHTIPWAQQADTDVTLRFNTKGDFDALNEFVEVYVEGTYVGRVYESGALCFSFGDIETITMTAEEWNAIVPATGGPVTVHMVASGDVDEFDCFGNYITLDVSYTPMPYSSDRNNDGVPDECQGFCSNADLTTQGPGDGEAGYGVPDGMVTGADLLYYVNAWFGYDLSIGDVTTLGTAIGEPGYGVPDGIITGDDISYFVNDWLAGCP